LGGGGVCPSLSLFDSHHNKKIVDSNHSRARGFHRDNGLAIKLARYPHCLLQTASSTYIQTIKSYTIENDANRLTSSVTCFTRWARKMREYISLGSIDRRRPLLNNDDPNAYAHLCNVHLLMDDGSW
jgi:hypothetical protein